jgi:hypothetical protein
MKRGGGLPSGRSMQNIVPSFPRFGESALPGLALPSLPRRLFDLVATFVVGRLGDEGSPSVLEEFQGRLLATALYCRIVSL